MKKVLLTDGMGPYNLGWGQDMFDLMGARLSRDQGPFTLRAFYHAFGLYTIAENISALATVLERPDEEIFRKELTKGYDYIGIQVITLQIPRIAEMIKIVKTTSPSTKVVIGGYGLLSLHDPLPNDPNNYAGYILKNADYECFEEGVTFFRKLLGNDPDAPITQNHQPLAGVTLPGLENIVNLPLSSTLVSLGCPNACEFCNTSAFFKAQKIGVSSPEEACESLKSAFYKMKDKPSLYNMIWDEDFLLDKPYVEKLGKLLRKENLISKVNIFCFASIKALSQYEPEELALAGIGIVWIGVESKFDDCITSEHNFQKRAGKDIREIFEGLHKYGILIIASNILGLDFHDHENLIEDIDYFVSLKPDLYQISPLTPCPGTKLYGRMKEDGRLFDSYSWEDLQLWKDDIFEYKNFKKNQIKDFFTLCHEKLYNENGPTVLSTMDVFLQGYRTMVHSKNPYLQKRAERYRHLGQKISSGLIYSIKKLAPSEAVLERALDVEERYIKYFGEYTLKEKFMQRFIYGLIKNLHKRNLKRESQPMPDPPWKLTQYSGGQEKPKEIGRKDPVRHFFRKCSVEIVSNITGMKQKYDTPRIRLKDIDNFDVNFSSIEIEGDHLNYVDEGQGEVILMLHGNPTWSYLYRDFIHAFKDDYRVIAPDHLGYGLSDKPYRADYSMSAHIRRLGKFIEALDLREITLVCQDWGGIIGLSYAAENKSRFKRLIPMNTTGFLPKTIWEFLKCSSAWAFPYLWSFKIPYLGKKMAMDWNIFLNLGMWLGIHNRKRQLHKKAQLGYQYPFQDVNSRIAILKSVRQVPMLPFSPIWKLLKKTGAGLDGWNVRTQIIWGTKDPVFVPWFCDRFEKMLPNHAPTLKIPTASHFLQDDEPELIINKIKEFLTDESILTKKTVTQHLQKRQDISPQTA